MPTGLEAFDCLLNRSKLCLGSTGEASGADKKRAANSCDRECVGCCATWRR